MIEVLEALDATVRLESTLSRGHRPSNSVKELLGLHPLRLAEGCCKTIQWLCQARSFLVQGVTLALRLHQQEGVANDCLRQGTFLLDLGSDELEHLESLHFSPVCWIGLAQAQDILLDNLCTLLQ